MINKALELLARDRLLYADMINLLTHADECDVQLINADSRGVMLLMDGGETCMTALFEQESAEQLLSMLHEPRLITSHQEWSEPLIGRMFGPVSDNTRCRQLVYTSGERLKLADCGVDIRPMAAGYIAQAAEYYHMGDEAYLAGRMEKGQLFGAFIGDKLTGFIGLHSETSIGMLEVLPEYRRRGIGSMLESFMINLQLDRGYTPFGQVVMGNEASMALQRSLGFELADGVVSWMTTRFADGGRTWEDKQEIKSI